LDSEEQVERRIRATQRWPLGSRIAVTATAVGVAYLVQLPLEREVPGEPFLVFFLAVIGTTLAFGSNVGFVAVGLTTLLSIPFFEPLGSLALTRARDLMNVELYAILGAGCVVAFGLLHATLISVSEKMRLWND
jgi:K+-sensing histidine kinase KdpD